MAFVNVKGMAEERPSLNFSQAHHKFDGDTSTLEILITISVGNEPVMPVINLKQNRPEKISFAVAGHKFPFNLPRRI